MINQMVSEETSARIGFARWLLAMSLIFGMIVLMFIAMPVEVWILGFVVGAMIWYLKWGRWQ